MLNQVVLVGRVKGLPEKKDFLEITVTRNFKNEHGEYETDNIKAKLTSSILENLKTYLTIGDLVGVKGRLQVFDNELTIVAEKITYLSNTREEIDN